MVSTNGDEVPLKDDGFSLQGGGFSLQGNFGENLKSCFSQKFEIFLTGFCKSTYFHDMKLIFSNQHYKKTQFATLTKYIRFLLTN
jgi:hypothetical protein